MIGAPGSPGADGARVCRTLAEGKPEQLPPYERMAENVAGVIGSAGRGGFFLPQLEYFLGFSPIFHGRFSGNAVFTGP
jgi:Na+-transporting methylmalonyl-CoA/oxaloacetate decarboxylase beta subunit